MMKPETAEQRAKVTCESKTFLFIALFLIYAIGRIVYKSLMLGKQPELFPLLGTGMFWEIIAAFFITGQLYLNLWSIRGNSHRENPVRFWPLVIVAVYTAMIMLYLASLFAYFLKFMLEDLLKT